AYGLGGCQRRRKHSLALSRKRRWNLAVADHYSASGAGPSCGCRRGPAWHWNFRFNPGGGRERIYWHFLWQWRGDVSKREGVFVYPSAQHVARSGSSTLRSLTDDE